MQITETPLEYLSADGHTSIHALVWGCVDWGDADVGDVVAASEAAAAAPEAAAPEAAVAPEAAAVASQPKAILQIIHGAAEHIARYRELAAYLVQRGFVVCGEDHIGHGRTAVPEAAVPEAAVPENVDENAAGSQPGRRKAQLSHMPKDGGRDILVGDVHRLRHLMAERYPQLPYLMLGHSMGSFILRAYLSEYCAGEAAAQVAVQAGAARGASQAAGKGGGSDADEAADQAVGLGMPLAGAVICGTGQQPALLSAFGNRAARIVAALRGADYRSRALNGLGMGAFVKAVKQRRTVFDWLSYNQENVDAYIADELSGRMFSVGAYATLTTLTAEVVRPDKLARLARCCPDLPLYFIAGADDPVGEMGAGVKRAYQAYADAGMRNLELKLYPDARHEILNESIRAEVYADLLVWLEATIAPVNQAADIC